MPDVIFDNCVLSNFALSGSLEVIRALYEKRAYITYFVAAENMKGITHGYDGLSAVRDALEDGWIQEVTLQGRQEKDIFESLSVSLGLGEASSMAVARMRKYLFACDDRMARKEADLLGIKLTGTVGILIKAIHSKVIGGKKADEILESMIRHGFYAPVDSVREVL